jgi:hypothetical protein
MPTRFQSENLKVGYQSEDLVVDRWIILECIGWERVDCIHLAQDRGKWRALLNTVTNFWVP